LERRRIDHALFTVVMEADLHGVSTRKVDDLVRALGAGTGISKSEVSRICADLDEEVAAFRDRSLADREFAYVFLDATYRHDFAVEDVTTVITPHRWLAWSFESEVVPELSAAGIPMDDPAPVVQVLTPCSQLALYQKDC
jgi:hypothetical protein